MSRRLLSVIACLGLAGCADLAITAETLTARDFTLAAPLDGTVTGTFQVSSVTGVTFELASTPQVGTLTVTNPQTGAFRYTVHNAAVGFDTFTYVARSARGSSNVGTVNVAITDGGVAGRLTYDFVPSTCLQGRCSLAYDQVSARPVRNVQVSLLDAANPQAVLAQTASDEQGRYVFPRVAASHVLVAVQASMDNPPFSVQDNTQENAGYVLMSEEVDTAASLVVDLHAASGWTGRAYTEPRAAAPFAILDTVYTAAQAFLAVRPAIVFSSLTVYWSSENIPADGALAAGEICTSHYRKGAIYLLGDANVDTDEYDRHVIAHEWGHYVEDTLSRSDSQGGPHAGGDLLDLRVAFSEGWGNAESAMTLYPDVVYVDTNGAAQSSGFSLDLANAQAVDPTPGWFSEISVGGILFDLYQLQGLGALYDVMAGPQRTTAGVTSLFSFVVGLKQLHPEAAAAIDAIVQRRNIASIQDVWGSGQTNDGGQAQALPVFVQASLDRSVQLTFVTVRANDCSQFNKLGTNRYVRFQGDGQRINIAAVAAKQIALQLFNPGGSLTRAAHTCTGASCVQAINNFKTQPGVDYVVSIESNDPEAEDMPCSLSLSH